VNISELIAALQRHMELYGDQPVSIQNLDDVDDIPLFPIDVDAGLENAPVIRVALFGD
jgi:hypothetical protein